MKRLLAAAIGGALLVGAPASAAQERSAASQGQLQGPMTRSVLSDAQKLEKSAESLDRMKSVLRSVLGRVEDARNEKDVVKLNCVNEKLTQVKALLKVAEQSDIQLHEALVNKDPVAESEFGKIAIARAKIDGLKMDADQCIGQLAYIVDEKTTVEVQQPAGLADRDGSDREGDHGRGRDDWRHGGHGPPVVRPHPASDFH
jgi:hypothetical protein